MGVRGNVRRNQDGHIIHANVDTDVIISDEPEYGSTVKPEEIYAVIEHFCLGEPWTGITLVLAQQSSLLPQASSLTWQTTQVRGVLQDCNSEPFSSSEVPSGCSAYDGLFLQRGGMGRLGMRCDDTGWRGVPAGQRRLELFGEDHNIRPGWVTVGRDLTSSNFDPQVPCPHSAGSCHLPAAPDC